MGIRKISMNERHEKTYSVKEAAKYSGVSEQTLRLWINPRDKKKKKKLIAEKIGNEYRIGESELKRIIDEKGSRQVCRDIDLIKECKSELLILGTNALGPLHQGREKIIERLKEGITVKILLLDPESSEFLLRSSKEETTSEGTRSGRLTAELEASLAICNDIYFFNKAYMDENPDKKHGSIEVRFRSETPIKSLIIIDPTLLDNAKCIVNYYPEDQRMRGITGTQKTITLAPPDTDDFISYVNDFDKIWEKKSRKYNWELKDVSSEENLKCLLATLKQPFKHAIFLKVDGSNELHIKHEDLESLQKEYPDEYERLEYYIKRGLAREVFDNE